MRVLHVIRDLAPVTGGPVTAVAGMAAAEAHLGHNVSIVATNCGLQIPPHIDNVSCIIFPYTLASWRYSRELSVALPALIENTDIVHIHTIWEHPTWWAARVCKKLDKRYILRPCGMLDKWSLTQSARRKSLYLRLFAGAAIRNASALHFTAEDELTNSVAMGRTGRNFVVPNGLALNAIENLPGAEVFRQRFPELADKRIILFLSRLHYKKQPNVVIEAFGKVCRMDNRLTLVLAGPTESGYLVELRRLVSDLHLSDRVLFTGMLHGSAVQEAYCAAELFVLPSLQENFGIAVAEAMAVGCPVVVSHQVNLASDIKEAKSGIVCEPNVASTAAAMEQLIANENLRAEMGANGRSLVLKKFTWSQVAESLLQIYEDIIESKQASPAWRSCAGEEGNAG